MINKLIIKDPFEMPAVDDTAVLVLRECADLVPHCWIWNESVGYLEVVSYSGYDIYVTVKNVGMKENATSGTIFPSCMEFLITAPNATPIIDNTVTCLKADFNSPTVGQTALMSVDNTSAIKAGDLIVVARDYQYVVSEVINDTTLLVLNDGKGKEGVIHIDCKACTSVKIFESTYCCNILQEEIDEINGKFEKRKSIIPWSGNSLVTISGGNNALISEHDVTIKVDDNLANFDNSESNFITSADLPTVNDATLTIYNSDGATPFIEFSANAASNVTATLPQSGTNLIYFEEFYDIALTTARFVPNTNSVATSYSLGNSDKWINESYIENTRVKTLIGQNYTDGITYPSSNSIGHTVIYDAGTISQTRGKHEFRTGGNTVLTINEIGETVANGDIVPESDNSVWIGGSGKSFAKGYINNIHSINTYTDNLNINDISHGRVATIYTYEANFNFSSISGVSNLVGSTHTISTNTITISNSYSHNIQCLIDVSMFISRLRISQTGSAHVDVSLLGQLNVTNTTTNTTNTIDMCNWYEGQILTDTVTGGSWKECCPVIVYTNYITLNANTTYDINASGILSFVGTNTNTTIRLSGGVSQKGRMRISMIIQ